MRVLAEIAGHVSIQTAQRYIDVNDEQMRRAADMRVHRVSTIVGVNLDSKSKES